MTTNLRAEHSRADDRMRFTMEAAASRSFWSNPSGRYSHARQGGACASWNVWASYENDEQVTIIALLAW